LCCPLPDRSLLELVRCGIVRACEADPGVSPAADAAGPLSEEFAAHELETRWADSLADIAKAAEGLSGRALRKLPIQVEWARSRAAFHSKGRSECDSVLPHASGYHDTRNQPYHCLGVDDV
jgi:hypothetical protein